MGIPEWSVSIASRDGARDLSLGALPLRLLSDTDVKPNAPDPSWLQAGQTSLTAYGATRESWSRCSTCTSWGELPVHATAERGSTYSLIAAKKRPTPRSRGAASPCGRTDGNRKLRGSRSLTFEALGAVI